MEAKFKTNIKCSGCVATVTPVLNETFGEKNWEVDIKDPKKILTVSSDSLDERNVKATLEKAGYKAEEVV